MRYRFYREHKYVSGALNDLERLIAQTDFTDESALKRVHDSFQALANMLIMHAHFEDERIHRLLRAKNSQVHDHAEIDHKEQQEQINALSKMFLEISEEKDQAQKIEKGYDLYLLYRKFVADNLLHLHEEETIILSELQRLYSDEELREVSAIAYRQMTPQDMTHMVEGLFPYMNKHDRRAFISNMRELEPEKFSVAWQEIRLLLKEDERVSYT